jgi:enamine deaminase RidA (YjgF/YER057c/UK114 family)
MKLKDKLIELNINLPDSIAPAGNYVPYKVAKNHIYISGQIPITKDAIVNPGKEAHGNINAPSIITGKVPSEVSVELATKAAEICIINTMSILIEATNNANCEQLSCLSISGFVNSDINLTEHPEIINGASDMIYKILGNNGKHTRIAVGCASLPRNAAVEISSIFLIN